MGLAFNTFHINVLSVAKKHEIHMRNLIDPICSSVNYVGIAIIGKKKKSV
jgi:hypothetical protein